MSSALLSIPMILSFAYGILVILKIWLPTICSNDTFLKIGATVILLDVLFLSLWSIRRNLSKDEYEKKNKYTD
tara:strand:+ start:267 stop:485 length:219 start_codon:yes stop_codon:yes gene_type:complete